MTDTGTRTRAGTGAGPRTGLRNRMARRGTGACPSKGLAVFGGALLVVVLGGTLGADLLTGFDPTAQQVGPRLAGPSAEHWMGTDRFGRDVASRVLHGGRQTLVVTGITLLIVVTVGTALGAAVAVAGPRLDRAVRTLIDLLIAFPVVIVVFAFVGLYGPSLTTVLGGALLVLWAPFARLSRALVRTALAEPSTVTARALGASAPRLLRTEVWPRLRGPVLVLTAVEAAQFISVVAGLSFLGFGAQPPTAEWGAMLHDGRGAIATAPHLILAPGIAVLVTVLGLTCLGEGLRDLLDRSGQVVEG